MAGCLAGVANDSRQRRLSHLLQSCQRGLLGNQPMKHNRRLVAVEACRFWERRQSCHERQVRAHADVDIVFDLLETSLKFLLVHRSLLFLTCSGLATAKRATRPVYQAGFSRSTAIHPAMAFVAPPTEHPAGAIETTRQPACSKSARCSVT